MAANNKTQLVLNHNNCIIMCNGQQPPATSVNFIHPIIT